MDDRGNSRGWLDGDDISEASQTSQQLPGLIETSERPSKRRRIGPGKAADHTTQDDYEDLCEPYSVRRQESSRRSADLADEYQALPREEEQKEVQKPKHKIHIPNNPIQHSTQVEYATQLPDTLEGPDSSPSRIRGAKWLFKKPEPPQDPKHRRPIVTAETFRKGPSTSSPASRGGRTPATVRRKPVASAEKVAAFAALVPPSENRHINTGAKQGGFQRSTSGLSQVDLTHELEGLDSDAFASSPELGPVGSLPANRVITMADYEDVPDEEDDLVLLSGVRRPLQRLVAPQTGLKQTTLFGSAAATNTMPASQVNKVRNYRIDLPPQKPTHHELDNEAIKTWVYPTNLGIIRDYQFTIVSNALFNNTLVALPTGLGKTFIAATVMLNFFRWTKSAKIVFMAPTKPLVTQQVDACFNIVGIPRSATTLLTGEVSPKIRAEEWQEKRVFFMTPQTLENDLCTGIADPKTIALLVVDEAHRASGSYAYTKVVDLLRKFNESFRVLALTATPGSSVEAVQDVIDNLGISEVEIRTEESLDIRAFVHRTEINQVELELSDEVILIRDLFSKAVQPLLDKLCQQKAYYNKDPTALTQFGVLLAMKNFSKSEAARSMNKGLKGMIQATYQVIVSVAHMMKLLHCHGMGPFYVKAKELREDVESKGSKGPKTKKQITDSSEFKKMMDHMQAWINNDQFVGHPKLTYLVETLLNHFLDAGAGRLGAESPPSATRVIVFCEYRESAEEICRVLNRHREMLRASVFVGQADTKTSHGMNQSEQQKVISDFKKGIHNVIVATSIGEEGLDIGQVDLIVCYDASASPIRMLQRMGRTGRKRAGNVTLLLMKNEVEAFRKAKDGYEKMQKMICEGKRFKFRDDLSHRIVPRDVKPVVDKRIVEIPIENTQNPSPPDPARRRPKPGAKMPKKKFHYPDGAELGFVAGGKLLGSAKSKACARKWSELDEDECMELAPLDSILLDAKDEMELEKRFLNVGGDGAQEVTYPDYSPHFKTQRLLGNSHIVVHGRVCEKVVSMMQSLHHIEQRHPGECIMPSQAPSLDPAPEAFVTPASPLARTKEPLTPRIEGFFPDVGEEDTALCQQVRAVPKPRKKAGRKRKAKHVESDEEGDSVDNSADNILSEDDSDDASDLADFLARSDEIIYDDDRETLPSSPEVTFIAPCKNKQVATSKPFFEMTQFSATQDSMNDIDMPDIEVLVGKTSGRRPLREMVHNDDVASNTVNVSIKAHKRRNVIVDSDDEDE